MGSTLKHTVVVGVDASPGALVGARYGAHQAEVRGLDLLLVHAYSVPPVDAQIAGDTMTCLREAGQYLLDDLVAELAVPSGVGVGTVLEQTAPIIALQRAAESARMVVLGQHHSRWLERLLLGPVASPLCTKGPCPVIIVPKSWTATTVDQPVIVALDGAGSADAALELAFEEAGLRRTGVVAVHAVSSGASAADVAAAERTIMELCAGAREQHPQTPFSVRTAHRDPSTAIIEASLGAPLVVLGAPHTARLGAWTRSVAGRVLKQATCPVAVVPKPHRVKATRGRGSKPEVLLS